MVTTTKIVQVIVDFDANGVSTGSCSVDGKRYSNFPAGLVFGQRGVGTDKHSIAFQAEVSDFGPVSTLSAAGTIIKRANEAGNGALSVVSIFQTEKTGQQYEMSLVIQ